MSTETDRIRRKLPYTYVPLDDGKTVRVGDVYFLCDRIDALERLVGLQGELITALSVRALGSHSPRFTPNTDALQSEIAALRKELGLDAVQEADDG